jgi:GAF domain-containing protein/HAMP domain-containing protein
LFILIPLFFLLIILISALYLNGIHDLQNDQIREQLASIQQQIGASFNDWVITKQESLRSNAANQLVIQNADILLNDTSTSSRSSTAAEILIQTLQSSGQDPSLSLFDHIVLLDTQGLIRAATNPEWVELDLLSEPYYEHYLTQNEEAAFLVYESAPLYTSGLILVHSTPIKDASGLIKATALGITEQNRIIEQLTTQAIFRPESTLFFIMGDRVIALNQTLNSFTDTVILSTDGSDNIISTQSWLSSIDAQFVIAAPQADLNPLISNSITTSLWMAGILSLITILVFVFIDRTIKSLLEVAKANYLLAEGKWDTQVKVLRNDELGLLGSSFNQMVSSLNTQFDELQDQVEERKREILTAAEVAQMVASARNLDDLFRYTTNLIEERLGHYHTAIFLIDETQENAILREASGQIGKNLKSQGYTIPLSSQSIISWVANNAKVYFSNNVAQDPLHLKHELLPGTVSEIGIPISTRSQVLGVLDVQSVNPDAFQPEIIDMLRTLANQLATAIQNFRLLEGTAIDLQEVSILYRGSRQIAQATTETEVYESATIVVQQTSFLSALYIAKNGTFRLVTSEASNPIYVPQLPKELTLTVSQVEQYLHSNLPTIIRDVDQPATPIHMELLEPPRGIQCQSVAYLPISIGGTLQAFIMLAARERGIINETALQPYSSLVELITTALAKINALQHSRQRIQDLEALSELGKAISRETDLSNLYESIYTEIKKLLGQVDFYIALYYQATEHIEFPYIIDEGQLIQIPPIPLGEGLTSVLIRSQKPLLIVENAETRARAMGAKVEGRWAKSWMGLPLMVAGQVVGALVVQDLENENRFTEEDLRLTGTLANQVATAVHTARLIKEGNRRALQLQTAAEIAREASSTIVQRDPLLQKAVDLIRDRFGFYQTSIFLADQNGQSLKVVASTGEAGIQMIGDGYTIELGSKSIISQTATTIEPLVVSDVTLQPSYRFNPLLPDTKSEASIPLTVNDQLLGVLDVQSDRRFAFSPDDIEVLQVLTDQLSVAINNAGVFEENQKQLNELHLLHSLTEAIATETDITVLAEIVHQEVISLIGDVDFYIALYDDETEHIEFPYVYDNGERIHIDPISLGDGLTSVVVHTKEPLIILENAKERAEELGARVIGEWARSWMGIPLITSTGVVGVMTLQDLVNEKRFTPEHIKLVTIMAKQMARAIHTASLLKESRRRALQLQTAAEIARESSSTMEHDQLLKKSVNLIRERFDFYHASVFLLDPKGEYAVVRESTGEAGRQMLMNEHKLAVGSNSVMGYVTANKEPLVVNDVTTHSHHRFNPLLPDTQAELGIPLMVGDRVLGAIDVQSTVPFAFSLDDIEVLQILADQLAIAISNSELFAETEEHLAQHRLIHHVTTVAASSSSLEDALSSSVQGLRVTLGDRVAILLYDAEDNRLRVVSAAGYDEDVIGMEVYMGQGITGWAAENREPVLSNNVLEDSRYIMGDENVRSELAVPLLYRGELIGVLNVESDEVNDFGQHDQDILGTLAGSLAAIIVNTRLSERQRTLLEVTNKIRRSVNMQSILDTTASELSKILNTRKASIQLSLEATPPTSSFESDSENGKEDNQ